MRWKDLNPIVNIRPNMGGGKKPSLAQIERAQKREDERKERKRPEERRQRISFSAIEPNPSELFGKIRGLGAITPQSVVELCSMSPGEAKRTLRRFEKEGLLSRISSFNGQPVYSLNSTDQQPSAVPDVAQ